MFCGAKQPPAPAVQAGLAKTAFGYSNEMMDQLRQSAAAPITQPGPAPAPYAASAPQPQPMPQRANQPSTPPAYAQATVAGQLPQNLPQNLGTQQTMLASSPLSPPGPAPQPMQSPISAQPQPMPAQSAAKTIMASDFQMQPPVAQSAAQQKTVFAAPSPVAQQATLAEPPRANRQSDYPMPGLNPPAPSPYGMPQPVPAGYGQGPAGYSPQPVQPQYGQQQPYAQQQQYAPPRPMPGSLVEPWRDSLKLVMIGWGLAVIALFATPLSTSPLVFSWDALIHGDGAARIPFLTIAALGVLGVVVGLLHMPSVARGMFAIVLALAVMIVPFAVVGKLPEWQGLVQSVALVLIVPALLVRAKYTDAALPRLLVTICVLGYLAPYLIPEHGEIPLVQVFKGLLDAEGKGKIVFIVMVARILLVVLTLLAWMPGPATAGGTLFAWLVILLIGLPMGNKDGSLLDLLLAFALDDHALDMAKHVPVMFLGWVLPTTCMAYIGYGLATVFGKQLE